MINCAGILFKDGFETAKQNQLRRVLDTNLMGPFNMAKKMMPLLKKSSDAKVINVSSQLGTLKNSGPAYAAYRISKTALNSMTRVMSQDLIDKNIKVFSVCPGWVHTDMGGPNAPRTPEQGASSILFPFYSKRAKTGNFYQDGKMLNW